MSRSAMIILRSREIRKGCDTMDDVDNYNEIKDCQLGLYFDTQLEFLAEGTGLDCNCFWHVLCLLF